jgi:hypothetical protein
MPAPHDDDLLPGSPGVPESTLRPVSLWGREPALIIGFAQAVLNLIAIAVHLDGEIVAATNAVVLAGASFLVRSQVVATTALNALAASSDGRSG